MKYASNNIRNILIAGHAGSGKTTLTEALVYFSGAAERMGRVEDGTTISDFDPEEAKRKASLSASVVPVEYEGIKYNLIDAPGLFDFEAGEYEGIRAAESVLVCVSGRSGVTVGAEKAFQLARKNGKATMVFISKCDLENANYFKILEEMKIKFGSTVCPCVVPAKLDDGTPVYINLFSQKAFKYESGKQIQVELPDIGHRFQGLIEAMSEAIAETDDELMEKFFGDNAADHHKPGKNTCRLSQHDHTKNDQCKTKYKFGPSDISSSVHSVQPPSYLHLPHLLPAYFYLCYLFFHHSGYS